MDNFSLLEILQHELKGLGYDAKVESQLALALEEGMTPEDFVVCCDGLFVREFSPDLINIEVKEDANKRRHLAFHLSRGGLYDQLPEGLFFQERVRRGFGYSAAEMAADHKLNDKKEEEIRRFFLPFENDFFWQRIQLEQEESRLLQGLQSGILNEYFVKFWNIPRSIPRSFVAPLILLLPYAHQIAGDLLLTAECLEQIFLEQVLVNKKLALDTQAPSSQSNGLGSSQLGIDLLCGEQFWEDLPVLEFVIGPLQRSAISDYLVGGNRFDLMNTFISFFVPAGLDVEFSIIVPAEKQHMMLKTEESPVLGYSSII